jgi:hypothetical protein
MAPRYLSKSGRSSTASSGSRLNGAFASPHGSRSKVTSPLPRGPLPELIFNRKHSALDQSLRSLCNTIVDLFVTQWFHELSPCKDPQQEILRALASICRNLERRCRRVDWITFFLTDLPHVLQDHVELIRRTRLPSAILAAKTHQFILFPHVNFGTSSMEPKSTSRNSSPVSSRANSIYQNGPYIQDHPVLQRLPTPHIFGKGKGAHLSNEEQALAIACPHLAVTNVNLATGELPHAEEWLRHSMGLFIQAAVPPETLQSPAEMILIREILVLIIAGQLETWTNPHHLFQTLINVVWNFTIYTVP